MFPNVVCLICIDLLESCKISILKNSFLNRIKKKIVNVNGHLLYKIKESLYRHYPTQDFEYEHLKNCRSLPTRKDLLKRLPKKGVVAEIGVSKGDFANEILTLTQPSTLYLIDTWADHGILLECYEMVLQRFETEIRQQKIEILQEDSVKSMATFPDQTFDWVYLDTYHLFENTRKELRAIAPKIKTNGIIAGHDYTKGNWNRGIRYGVKEAVREFCIEFHWELIYLTHELSDNGSFAIRKIDSK